MRFKYSQAFAVAVSAVLLITGCSAKARAQKYLTRGNDFYEKQDFTKAKLEYLNAYSKGSRDPQLLARLGECFLRDGDGSSAVRFLNQALDLQPTNNEVRAKLGSIYLLGRRPAEAAKEAEAILSTDPANRDAVLLRTDLATNDQQIAELKTRWTEAQQKFPATAAFPFALGVLASREKDLPAAKSFFEKSLSLDTNQPKAHMALAEIARMQKDTNAADAQFRAAASLAPAKSWERLKEAEHLISTQRREEAEKILLDAIKQEPDFVQALNMLTESLIMRNKLDEAQEYNKKALTVSANNRDALLNRARLRLVHRDAPGAIDELQEMLKTYNRDAGLQYQLALAHLANRDAVKALGALDTALTIDPNHAQAVLLRSELRLRTGNVEGAISDLLPLTRNYPQLTQGRFLLGNAYQTKGDYANALAIYKALSKDLPKDPRPAYLAALCYRNQKNLAEARKSLEESLAANATFLPALQEILNIDVMDKKTGDAMARIDSYLQKYPDKPALLLLKAKVQVAEKKIDDAVATVEKAVQIEPNFYQAQRALVQLLLGSGKRDEAITKLEALVKKNDKDAGAHLQLGMLREALKDTKSARAHYEAVLKVATNQPVALNNLANILLQEPGELDQGLEYARRAYEAVQNQPELAEGIADTYGWALWKKGEYARALPILEESTEKLADNPEAVYHLGMAYYMTGRDAEAAKALETAVRSSTDFTGKERARGALAILKIDPAQPDAKAIQLLRDTLAMTPADVTAQIRLAQISEHQKNWRAAAEGYEGALKLTPRSQPLLARLADLYATQLGNSERALELARQCWAIEPNPKLAPALGRIGYEAGDFKWAAVVLGEARRAQPADSEIAYYLALSSYAGGDLQQARNALQDSVRLTQNQPALAKPALALIQFQLSPANTAEAAAAVATAIAADPNFPPALITSGLLAEQKGDDNSARASYEQVLKLHPNHLPAQKQLGLLLAELGSGDEQAVKLLTTAKNQMTRSDPKVTKALGILAYRRGDYREASRLLSDARMELANDAGLLYYLGISQHRLNERGAKDSLTRALQLDAGSKLAADAKKALAEMQQ